MHARQETARVLTQDCDADYLITSVKGNQPSVLEDLQGMDFKGCPAFRSCDKGHGRIDTRSYFVKDISGSEWDGYADLHGRRTAVLVERERHALKTDEATFARSWALTSVPAGATTPEQLGGMIRCHWAIENTLHWVLHVRMNDDKQRNRKQHGPENFATMRRLALNIARNEPSGDAMRGKLKRALWNDDFSIQMIRAAAQ